MARVTDGEIVEDEGVYGVRLLLSNGHTLCLRDVDTSRCRVSTFLARLINESIDEAQLRYLAEDLLAAEYDGTRS